MHEWISRFFGSVSAVERQAIVRTTNLITMEGALFNGLRASRPFESQHSEELEALASGGVGDPFCAPLEGTPEDVFGRVRGRHSITASNVAKYDVFHGVIIFDEHNPLRFDADSISDTIDVAMEWGGRVLEADREARYLFVLWNCLWKAGASILHGHAQVVATRDLHYPKVESLRRQAISYRERYASDYFSDLVAAHRSVGLVSDMGTTQLVTSLTPIKEKEVWLLDSVLTTDLKKAVAHTLDRFVHALGVSSFNLVIYMPPLASCPEDWSEFPHIVRIVDRGELTNKTADMGAMELYAASVVASDPYRIAAALGSPAPAAD
jgi:hypothetical protein